MTEEEFRTLNDRWKKLRAKSRDRSVTEAVRAAFARKANEIKAYVHAQLGDSFDVTTWVATDPHQEPEEATMIPWIGQPTAWEPFILWLMFAVAVMAIIHFIATVEKIIETIQKMP